MFMQPQITKRQDWALIMTDCDSDIMPWEYCDNTANAEKINGFGCRLSAPGYLDCTDWAVFNSPEECFNSLQSIFCTCSGENDFCDICAHLQNMASYHPEIDWKVG